MAALTSSGTLSYHGVTFGVFTKSNVKIRPIPDRAKRTTVALEYFFDVSSYILAADGGDTSAEMLANVQRALTHKGGRLQYLNWGFGDLDINNPNGTVRDITYGPHPELIDCVHLGPNNAWLVKWTCRTTIPNQCSGASYSNRDPLLYNYEMDVAIDKHGYTTRTVTGVIEIPVGQLAGSTTVPAAADNQWERIYKQIPIPPGFQRQTRHQLDDSKRVMHFTIVDQEEPRTAFMMDCTEWNGSHELSGGLSSGWATYTNTISATYRLSRDAPKVKAFQHFGALVKSRIDKSWANSTAIIPLDFRCTDRLHNDEVSFSFTYSFTITGGKETALLASGMWEPIPQNIWQRWAATVSDTAAHPLGNAKFLFNPTSDAIISLCGNKLPPPMSPGQAATGKPVGAFAGNNAFQENRKEEPEFYAYYECWLEYSGFNAVMFHHPLGSPPDAGKQKGEDKFGYKIPFGQGNLTEDFVQYAGAAGCVFILCGRAMRAGQPVTPPTLHSVGGVEAILVQPWVRQKEVARYGKKVFVAEWRLVYRLPKTTPFNMPMPPNPLIDGNKAGNVQTSFVGPPKESFL